MKFCPRCKLNEDFYSNKRTPDGLAYICKKCMADYSKEYRAKNKAKLAELKKSWYCNNKEQVLEYAAHYYQDNKKDIIKKVVSYRKRRLKVDPEFKLQKNLRHRLAKMLKQQSSKKAIDFLGCTLKELKNHLESKFQQNMTWDNYGEWHIDHIVPLASFDLINIEQLKKACHYTNLQPLWAKDNISKGDKVQ